LHEGFIASTIYHPDFHESIAVDARIRKPSQLIRYAFKSHIAHEQFYLEIANDASSQGWEADWMLYNYNSYFQQVVNDAH
jgi:hypothetical protein